MWKSIRTSVLAFSLFVSLATALPLTAQTSLFPENSGDKCCYSAYVEIKKAHASGVCILANNSGVISGSMFNEFGISMFDFTYDCESERVQIENIASKLDKWYIRRVLKRDLRSLMKSLQTGGSSYSDTKHGVKFTLMPIAEDNNKEDEITE